MVRSNNGIRIYIGYYLALSNLLLLMLILINSVLLEVIEASIFHNLYYYSTVLFFNGWVSAIILLFWMLIDMVRNKKLKFKFLWILSSLVIFTGAPIAYFLLIYRDRLDWFCFVGSLLISPALSKRQPTI